MTPVTLSGRVVAETVNAGSKSEHRAVVLKTADGESYVLRRKDGPTFADDALNDLIGQDITARGHVMPGGVLIMSEWGVEE
jgi:hypothetical protein